MALYKGEDKIKDIYLGDVPIFKVYAGEEFCGFFTFSHENLISNSDLLIDSDSDSVPDGFSYVTSTDISLTNGIAKFTATAQYGDFRFYQENKVNIGDTFYTYASINAGGENYVRLVNYNGEKQTEGTTALGFNFYSLINTSTKTYIRVAVRDNRASNWTPIEVDYIGLINITDLVSRGILPSGLTNLQYKDILDNYFNS